nr:hypothetical protein [uncultured Desulfuromonas sp.]
MKKIFFLVLLVCLSSTSAAVASTIDLSAWTAYPGGSWNVASDGSNVLQTTNGDPTYFVSNDNYINTVFNGQFSVETASDDDFIGFVFGFNGTDDFLLFDWKQGTQYYSGYTANSGFTLSSVTGSVTFAELWGHTGNGASLRVLPW